MARALLMKRAPPWSPIVLARPSAASAIRLTLILTAAMLAAPSGEAFERELPLQPRCRLVVELPRGSLQVSSSEAGAAPSVRARAAGLGASEVVFEVQHRTDAVHLVVREPAWIQHLASPPLLEVEARVPRGCPVERAGKDANPLLSTALHRPRR